MTHASPLTVDDICKAVGRRAIADSVGVGLTAVSNAVVEGQFPARWFVAVRSLCEAADLPCPIELFSFAMPPANGTGAVTVPASPLNLTR